VTLPFDVQMPRWTTACLAFQGQLADVGGMNRCSTLRAWLFVGYGMLVAIGAAYATPVNITEHHNHDTRDGLFIDPAFTQAARAGLRRDLAFDGAIQGNVYAQPLYIENGKGGKAMVIAVTESNNVYALDAADGSVIWQRNVGQPAPVKLTFPPCWAQPMRPCR
jgi:hypothetical protein